MLALEIMEVVYVSCSSECKHTTGKKTDNIHRRQTDLVQDAVIMAKGFETLPFLLIVQGFIIIVWDELWKQ